MGVVHGDSWNNPEKFVITNWRSANRTNSNFFRLFIK